MNWNSIPGALTQLIDSMYYFWLYPLTDNKMREGSEKKLITSHQYVLLRFRRLKKTNCLNCLTPWESELNTKFGSFHSIAVTAFYLSILYIDISLYP